MKIAIAQTDLVQGEISQNLKKIADFARRAKEGDAQIVIFPEMCISGFDYAKNLAYLHEHGDTAEKQLCEIARTNDIALCGSVPHLGENDKLPTNRMLFIGASGRILAHYDKVHLFSVFNENKYVKAGDDIVVADTPFGKIGLAVCYDIRFPELFTSMAKRDAKLIIISAAFPHPRSEHWRILCRARAIENQCFVVGVNRGGTENFGKDTVKYFGLSAAIDPWGGIIAECPENDETLVFADINLEDVENIRAKIPAQADRREDVYCASKKSV